MSRRRHSASSSTTAAAMSLAQLERWLQDRAERRPVATSLSVLDGYVAAIVAGPVSISPLDWICPLLAIDADAFNHGGTAEFAAISAVVQHHNAISNTLSTNPKQFEPIHPRKPNGDVDARPLVSGIPSRHAAATIGLGTTARHPQHQPRPAATHPAALCGRSGPSAARTGKERSRDQGIPAQRPHRYPGGRRGHAPVLDADPLRPQWVITAYVEAHAGYE
jgi:hypothetical protein